MTTRSFKGFIKLIFLFLVFTGNIRVGAKGIEVPQNCSQQNGPCAYYSEGGLDKLSTKNATAQLAQGATLQRTADGQMELVRGTVRVSAKGLTIIHTLYGNLYLSDGDVLIEAVDSVVSFTNLSSSDLSYQPRGEMQKHSLPVGFSTYLAKITKTGVAEAGYPHPAEIDQLLKKWGRVYAKSDKQRFGVELKNFLISWREATQLVGPWYLDTVKREIASAEAEKERIARLKAEREAENNKLRGLFERRVFDP